MAQRQDHFLPRGGLDLVTSALAIPKGLMIAVKNYESSEGGYRRVGGYERYDGRPAPSDATFWIQNFDGASSLASKGDTIEGGMSGETAVVLDTGADAENPVVLSGSTAGGDAAGYYVLADVSGDFTDGEDLEVGGSAKGQADGAPRKEAADLLPPIAEQKADPVTHGRLQGKFGDAEITRFPPAWNCLDGEDMAIEDVKALHFTDMSTQPAAELADRRLRDLPARNAMQRPRRHWYSGPRNKHRRPEAVALFHRYYREATEGGSELSASGG